MAEKIPLGYEVRYENGSSHMLHEGQANSLEQAIKISKESILHCLYEGFNPEDMVMPIIARKLGLCALCGSTTKLKLIHLDIRHNCLLCDICMDNVKRIR